MSFLVTAYGRSGTTFLARMMNRSKVWDVRHEPRGSWDAGTHPVGHRMPNHHGRPRKRMPVGIQQAFDAPHYGEVNSYLRYWFRLIDGVRRGIIIRDPRDVVVSVANRHPLPGPHIEDFVHCWWELLRWSFRASVLQIDFRRMTEDPQYLDGVLRHFDITDVHISADDVATKVNAGTRDTVACYADLPRGIRRRVDPLYEAYRRLL